MTVKRVLSAVQLLVLLALASTSAQAQSGASGLAGVVRDTSGAVLPGATVEASSPALIEKVRTVVTDGEGQYKITDLPSRRLLDRVHADRLQYDEAGRH